MDKLKFSDISECIKDTSKILNTDENIIIKSLLDTEHSDIIKRYIKDKKLIEVYSKFVNLPLDILRKKIIDELYPGDVIVLCSVNKDFKDVICNSQFWRLYMKMKFKVSVPDTFSNTDLNELIKTYKFLGSMDIEPTHEDLIEAINTDNILMVELLLNWQSQPDSEGDLKIKRVDPTDKNNEAIRTASVNGHTEVVELLLNWRSQPDSQGRIKRVDPSAKNNEAIRWTSRYGNTSIVELLLKDKRVDPSANNNEAIILSSAFGHTSVVKLLLKDKRVDPAANNNEAIRKASREGQTSVVDLLLKDKRVDPSVNQNGAIIVASMNGHISVVKRLLKDKRVDPSDHNNAAIVQAKQYGHHEIFKLLLADKRVFSTYL